MLALQMFTSPPSASRARTNTDQAQWSMQDPTSPNRARSLSLCRQHVEDGHEPACRDSGYHSSSNTPFNAPVPEPETRGRQSSTREALSVQRMRSGAAPSEAVCQPDCIETDVSKKWFGSRRVQLNVYQREIPSSVRARYEDLKELLTRGLLEAILSSKFRHHGRNIGMKLKVLGATEDTAKPYIVVLCDEPLKKVVHRFFDRANIKTKYHEDVVPANEISFGLAVCAMPPQFRAHQMAEVHWSQATSRMTEGTLCGGLIYAGDESQMIAATLGGVLDVQTFDGTWIKYGMTAAHLLQPWKRTEAYGASEAYRAKETPFIDAVDDDSDVEDEALSDYDFEIVLAPQQGNSPSEPKGLLEVFGIAFTDTNLASFLDLDFALVMFNEEDTAKPNVMINWQLSDEEEPTKMIRLNDIHPLDGVFTSKSVLVLWNGENIKGTLSRDATSLLTGLSSSFVETFTLVLGEGGAFPAGISGSWVVDGENGIVYGHIAAVDAFDEAYVVPLASVVDRILLGLPAKAVRLDWPAKVHPHATVDDPRNVASEPPPAATHSLTPHRRGNIVSLQEEVKNNSVGSGSHDSGYASWTSSARASSNEMGHAHPPLTIVPAAGLPFGRPAGGNFTSSLSQPNLTSKRRIAGVDQRPVDLLYSRDGPQASSHSQLPNSSATVKDKTAVDSSKSTSQAASNAEVRQTSKDVESGQNSEVAGPQRRHPKHDEEDTDNQLDASDDSVEDATAKDSPHPTSQLASNAEEQQASSNVETARSSGIAFRRRHPEHNEEGVDEQSDASDDSNGGPWKVRGEKSARIGRSLVAMCGSLEDLDSLLM